MKALLVGLGSAGFSWYKKLRDRGLLAAVVEMDPSMKSKMEADPFPFYTSLEEALQKEKVDFVVNVTSPMAHTPVNNAAFDRKLPVLCEKPISFDYNESIEVVRRAEREGIPFMIAENYRCLASVRKLKQVLDSGAIGRISTLDILFYRYHHVERKYTVSLLDDIGVHHFDMIRYLTGAEGISVYADMYNPIGGWEEEGAVINTNAVLELEGGIKASYTGSIASRGVQTPWMGNWHIEGTEGMIEYKDQIIHVVRGDAVETISDFSGVHAPDALTEFVRSLEERRPGETSGTDYLKTQALVHYAKLSNEEGRRVPVVLP
ncbi:Putative UDP-kanosamine synthase oxidoreductase subunit [Paenibacillus konkukensis]|uniref:UDP-kanosamine synthase oxidoreductase subunit n=1 Tax=Paenibacillus konkukensis TaxID=2020716 RepID=A0ABY4RWG1_9BACL|nr:Gfo/Idh/MocA family oxidoreductase [Paenibacillus konkukensis]UQZ86104.1 Putative UDP-kanosamine synthase oxidoreductase subunit [Paenibacillus konkukensis]